MYDTVYIQYVTSMCIYFAVINPFLYIPVIVIMATRETMLALFAQSILSGDGSLMVGQT